MSDRDSAGSAFTRLRFLGFSTLAGSCTEQTILGAGITGSKVNISGLDEQF